MFCGVLSEVTRQKKNVNPQAIHALWMTRRIIMRTDSFSRGSSGSIVVSSSGIDIDSAAFAALCRFVYLPADFCRSLLPGDIL